MTRRPLLLPPPAVSTSPSRLRRSSASIVVKSPSRCSSPLSCRHAVHHRSAAPSITVHSPSRCPSPPIAVVLSVHRRRSRAVPCCRGAVTRRPSPSMSRRAISHRLSSRCAVPCHQGAVTSFIAVEEPSRCTSPSRSRRLCRLTTPVTRLAPPSLSSGWLSRCFSSRHCLPFAGASHCGHRLSCLSSGRLVLPSPRFSHRHLPSASASASHRAVTSSCHAHLGPLVRLVKASPLLTPPPPICGIIESSQRSGLILV
jgi:hypothetical protein